MTFQIFQYVGQHAQSLLNYTDVFLLMSGAMVIGAHLYERYRDSVIGVAIIICWVWQSHDILTGAANSSLSNTFTDFIFWLIILACKGNIMSVVILSNITAFFKSIWKWIKRPFEFLR